MDVDVRMISFVNLNEHLRADMRISFEKDGKYLSVYISSIGKISHYINGEYYVPKQKIE